MPRTSIEIQVRPGGQWVPGELASDSSTGSPVVIVAGTSRLLGPDEVAYIRADEETDPEAVEVAERAGFMVIRG